MFATRNRFWIGLGTLAAVALGASTAEACWGFRCCKARTSVRATRYATVAAYYPPVAKTLDCEFGYYPVYCNTNGRWEVIDPQKKEACVAEELLGEKCGNHRGVRVRTATAGAWIDYLYPAWYDKANSQWRRSRVGDRVQGYVPETHLPEAELP
jgi:hypothetical protein